MIAYRIGFFLSLFCTNAGSIPRFAVTWSEDCLQQAYLLPILCHSKLCVFHLNQQQLKALGWLLHATNLWPQRPGPVGIRVEARLSPHKLHGCWQRCFSQEDRGWVARCTEAKSLDLSFLEIEKVLLEMLKKNEVISLLHGLNEVFGKITSREEKGQEDWKWEWEEGQRRTQVQEAGGNSTALEWSSETGFYKRQSQSEVCQAE